MPSRVILSTFVLTVLSAGAAPAFASWETVAEEQGVLVMMREVPGRTFPTLRTVAVINENIYDVLAVLSDVARFPQWMARCAEARRLSQRGELEYVTYSRTAAPWPVSDRDAVYLARATVHLDQRLVMVRFRAVKNDRVPPKDGVVRLANLQGYYGLKVLGPRKTQIDYQLNADPGGWIPAWVGKITAKRAVIDTILALRSQVRKTRGNYSERIGRWKQLYYLPLAADPQAASAKTRGRGLHGHGHGHGR